MEINKIIEITIDEFNKSQNEYEINNKPEFLLIGNESSLDSLANVNFLTKLEKNIFKHKNKEIDLINKIFLIKKDKINLKDLANFLSNNL
tara:strand:+ start:982 stop:1251 length:270 start_codon:yes stop_codon:yes gene_type:complete